MWNAGDITVEASKLPNAIYASGWQNYRGNSKIIRKLVVNALFQAQRPVVMKAFNIVELSYETYVMILKTSYSVFSVFH
ncbi:odorant receptor Or2-like [Anticarsia gemmatalis]|uniref:odorant receptor Or2-like n=1 Tax=Anticarsia gemmatalis TaxID=129554 RepID=UPI003F76A477